jgi:hypothetical protein
MALQRQTEVFDRILEVNFRTPLIRTAKRPNSLHLLDVVRFSWHWTAQKWTWDGKYLLSPRNGMLFCWYYFQLKIHK